MADAQVNILIVEDSPTQSKLLRLILEENGYSVEALFAWYCANFEKAWCWMYPKKKQSDCVDSSKSCSDTTIHK